MESHKKIKVEDVDNLTQVELNELFICEGILYSIAVPETTSTETQLSNGRSIYEFIRL